MNVATQGVAGERTLTANHDLTIVNAGATGFSKDPVAFRFAIEAARKSYYARLRRRREIHE